jgi:hypothetical protein
MPVASLLTGRFSRRLRGHGVRLGCADRPCSCRSRTLENHGWDLSAAITSRLGDTIPILEAKFSASLTLMHQQHRSIGVADKGLGATTE